MSFYFDTQNKIQKKKKKNPHSTAEKTKVPGVM